MKINSLLKNFWPIIVIFALWFGFSFPYFVQNRVPYPSAYQVDFFSPWNRYGTYAGPVKNNAMPDVINQIYPWKYFSVEQLKQGAIPLWNPNSFSGTPHVANYQSAVFSPFTLLYFLFPFITAWSLIILFQPLLAGVCMYLYLRMIKVGQVGSLISSISYMFAGFLVVWMAYGTLSMVVAFLPLILYFIEKTFVKRSPILYIGISFAVAFCLLSGHFQMSLYVIGLSMLYIWYKAYVIGSSKSGLLASLFVFLGIGLAMIQILPTMEFYTHAFRNKAFNTGAGIPFYNLVTAFAPDFFGNPVTRNNKFLDYAEWQAFIGTIPLFLASFVSIKRKSLVLFFVCAAVLSIILAIASPLQNVIGSLHIPVISTSVQSRIIALFAFSIAVLAGFGYDSLQKALHEKQYKKVSIRIGIYLVIICGIWGITLFSNALSPQELSIAKKNLLLPTGVLIFASLATSGAFILRKKIIYVFLAVVLIGLCSFESFRFAYKWMPFDPASSVFPNEKIVTFLQNNKGHGRVFGNLGGQMEIYYNLPSADGYDSLYIQRYGEFIASSVEGTLTEPTNRVVLVPRIGKNTDRVLNLLNVSLIVHPIADTNATWAYPVWNKQGMNAVYKDKVYTVYKNRNAIPRAKMFYSFKEVPSKEQAIKTFYSANFDYKNTLILEEKAPGRVTKNGKNVVTIASETPNKIIVKVNTESSGMLFLSDPYYPGWKATVDGKPRKIYRADYAFRSIWVEKGMHTIVFSYQPESFRIGVFVSLLSLGSIFVLAWIFSKGKESKRYAR